MSDPFLGEIRYVAFDFAPRGWLFCNGALLSIQQYTALFSLLGTNYGGNGTTNFGLPDLAARQAAGQGTGFGLTSRSVGDQFGVANVTLSQNEMPQHTHTLTPRYGRFQPRTATPAATSAIGPYLGATPYTATGALNAALAPQAVTAAGGGQPHNNQQPGLVLTAIICISGGFPSRN